MNKPENEIAIVELILLKVIKGDCSWGTALSFISYFQFPLSCFYSHRKIDKKLLAYIIEKSREEDDHLMNYLDSIVGYIMIHLPYSSQQRLLSWIAD